jgi:hypothetical protein
MKADTRLAVFSLSTRLTLLQGFTSDPQLLLAAVSGKSITTSGGAASDSFFKPLS